MEKDVGRGLSLEVAAKVIGHLGDQGIDKLLDAGRITGRTTVLCVDPVAVAKRLQVSGLKVSAFGVLNVSDHCSCGDIGQKIDQIGGAVGACWVFSHKRAALL